MVTVADQRVDPPEQRKPCPCDIRAVISEVANTLDDAMYEHGLEWDCSVAKAEGCLREYINTMVEAPVGTCEECR